MDTALILLSFIAFVCLDIHFALWHLPNLNLAQFWRKRQVAGLGQLFLAAVASLSAPKGALSSLDKPQKQEGSHMATPPDQSVLLSSPELESALLEPYKYIASAGGKGFRNKLILAFNHWFRVPSAQLDAILRVVEMLHNASLLVDDIEDDSDMRRGRSAAHIIFGVPMTINTANYIYFLAYEEVLKLTLCQAASGVEKAPPSDISRRFIQIINDEMLALHRGQGAELIWRDHLQCPTEEEYIEMVRGKTSGLLRIAVRLMVECATVDINFNYVELVDLLGIWFQIRDDYMNLQNDTYMDQKGYAEDLSEGKFSFPIIHGVREKPESRHLLNILRQRPQDEIIKREAISYLDYVTHSFEYTLGSMRSWEARTRAEVTRLGGNPKLEVVLDMLTA